MKPYRFNGTFQDVEWLERMSRRFAFISAVCIGISEVLADGMVRSLHRQYSSLDMARVAQMTLPFHVIAIVSGVIFFACCMLALIAQQHIEREGSP